MLCLSTGAALPGCRQTRLCSAGMRFLYWRIMRSPGNGIALLYPPPLACWERTHSHLYWKKRQWRNRLTAPRTNERATTTAVRTIIAP